MWHHRVVDQEQAMTEVREALADLNRQNERRARLADALLNATEAGIQQKDLVAETGYTREHIRRLVAAARKRRAAAAS